jgi:hypothetical protein
MDVEKKSAGKEDDDDDDTDDDDFTPDDEDDSTDDEDEDKDDREDVTGNQEADKDETMNVDEAVADDAVSGTNRVEKNKESDKDKEEVEDEDERMKDIEDHGIVANAISDMPGDDVATGLKRKRDEKKIMRDDEDYETGSDTEDEEKEEEEEVDEFEAEALTLLKAGLTSTARLTRILGAYLALPEVDQDEVSKMSRPGLTDFFTKLAGIRRKNDDMNSPEHKRPRKGPSPPTTPTRSSSSNPTKL